MDVLILSVGVGRNFAIVAVLVGKNANAQSRDMSSLVDEGMPSSSEDLYLCHDNSKYLQMVSINLSRKISPNLSDFFDGYEKCNKLSRTS